MAFLRAWCGLAAGCAATGLWAQGTAALPAVTITGALPIPGLGQPLAEMPAAVQTATDADLASSQAVDLSSFMNERLGGVHVNQLQGNPFQMDVSYRGFTASPLLGTPQGLSVYLDGVRLNQPFGDVVSWDLIPRAALASITLMPGSNPLFGLNTLGGALSLQTKSGLSHPGTFLQTTLGSGQRRSVELEHGGRNERGLNWFVTGHAFNEEGWRDASPSRLRQLFGKLGWKDARSSLALSLSHSHNALTGNGLQEERMLAAGYRSIYTQPDITRNRATLLSLTGRHELSDSAMLSGNLYQRQIRTQTLNGDVNDDALGQDVYQLGASDRNALASAGYTGYPSASSGLNSGNTPFPMWRCLAQTLQNDEPAEACTGLLNRSSTRQSNLGAAGQLSLLSPLWGQPNQFTVGLAYDVDRTDLSQTSQLGYVNTDRSVVGLPAYADGVSGGTQDGQPFDRQVNINGRASTWSIFATDTLSLAERWHLTLSARYNRTHVVQHDQRLPGGGPGSLDGNQVFQRLNPAAGLAFLVQPGLSAYAGVSQSSRTPSAIEMGCADPANPCKLPNAMAGDPPLKQVVTQTWEAGLRGRAGASTQWTAGLFSAQSSNDILFVASDSANGFGYFKNFGKTLRRGLELGLNSQPGALSFSAHYTWLDATYQTAETVGGAANSSSDANSPGLDGNIAVRPGDRMPLTPQHIFKLHANYQVNAAWRLGLGLTAFSRMLARGNENNQHRPDGQNYLGSGWTPGYGVVNFNAVYQPTTASTWTLNLANLFDRRYASAGQLGPTAFNAQGNALVTQPYASVGSSGAQPGQNSLFVAPGAPRSVFLGWRYRFS